MTAEAVLDFLRNPRAWHMWVPEEIRDRDLREWAMEVRRGVTYITTGEVARRYCVTTNTVHSWIKSGRLPAVRRVNWMIDETDLARFEPPHTRSKRGMARREWTAEETATLARLRGQGLTYAEIAEQMGRPTAAVSNRWLRIRAAQGVS